jgi:WD40 repeat protein
MIGFYVLSNPELAKKRVSSHSARGEPGVQTLSLAISPATATIATTGSRGRIALRTSESGWSIDRFLDFPGFATEVAFSPDGQSVAAVGFARGIYLWDLGAPTSQPTHTLPVPFERAKHVMYSPDGKSVAVTSDRDGTIAIWDLVAWRERMILRQSSPAVQIAFSPDGRWLATTEIVECSILLWDLETGSRRTLLEHAPANVMALAFTPDGAMLASAAFGEHQVRLWDLKTQRLCREFAGHALPVNSVAFSPDGSLLATAGNDGMVGLWTVATGERLLSLDSQATCLRNVAFSPDGRTLILATNDDDDIRSWDVAELLAAAETERRELASVGQR